MPKFSSLFLRLNRHWQWLIVTSGLLLFVWANLTGLIDVVRMDEWPEQSWLIALHGMRSVVHSLLAFGGAVLWFQALIGWVSGESVV